MRAGTQAVRELVREQRFDAIISTSPPAATHLVAARAHGAVPWIADLRDPWYRRDDAIFPKALVSIDGLLEPHTFQTASALTIVSEPLAEDLRNRYPSTAVHSIPNAFSEREWIGVPFAEPKRATFLHPGQLYEGGRDPRPFFETLAELLKSGTIARSEIAVELYGRQGEWLTNAISRLGLDDVVRVHGNAPREQILRLERAATRLLVFL